MTRKMLPMLAVATALSAGLRATAETPPAGFVSIFNGKDLGGWRVPAGDNGHWRVVDGVIDYDAESEAAGEKHLWTEKEYGDFTLRVDWRIKETPYTNPNVHIVKPDGLSKLDAYELLGKVARIRLSEMVDPNYVVVASIEKKYLPKKKE
jgi:hypothetical protein